MVDQLDYQELNGLVKHFLEFNGLKDSVQVFEHEIRSKVLENQARVSNEQARPKPTRSGSNNARAAAAQETNQEDDNCYLVGPELPYIRAKLRMARYNAASLTLPSDELWITGGEPDYLSSTEIITADQNEALEGPVFDGGIDSHCMVALNDAEVMLTGGTKKQCL